jgi:hypothetical protein
VGITLAVLGGGICWAFFEDQLASLLRRISTRLLHIENLNSPPSEPENLIGNIELKNSIVSIASQPSDNINYYNRAAATSVEQQISRLLPSYDDVIQQNSVTIIIDPLSLLPPSYEDFFRQNNHTEEADL